LADDISVTQPLSTPLEVLVLKKIEEFVELEVT